MDAIKFYKNLSSDYDDMTRFQQRLKTEMATMKQWIARYRFSSVVDVACGTGLHAILLAKMGVRTVGVDISENMLEKAKQHANEFNVSVSWIQTPMQKLHQHLKDKFDAVFCWGNSIPHILNEADLMAVLQNFAMLLRPGGLLALQLLNYHRILKNQQRIVGIHRHNSVEYIRFYDLHPQLVQFNILTIKWKQSKVNYQINSTPLFPYTKSHLEPALVKNDFNQLEFYGNMGFVPFDEQSSQNLVIVARK